MITPNKDLRTHDLRSVVLLYNNAQYVSRPTTAHEDNGLTDIAEYTNIVYGDELVYGVSG